MENELEKLKNELNKYKKENEEKSLNIKKLQEDFQNNQLLTTNKIKELEKEKEILHNQLNQTNKYEKNQNFEEILKKKDEEMKLMNEKLEK